MVVANDVSEVQEVAKYHRGVAQNARVRIKYGMDGGQGSLKLCMSVITEKPEFCHIFPLFLLNQRTVYHPFYEHSVTVGLLPLNISVL